MNKKQRYGLAIALAGIFAVILMYIRMDPVPLPLNLMGAIVISLGLLIFVDKKED